MLSQTKTDPQLMIEMTIQHLEEVNKYINKKTSLLSNYLNETTYTDLSTMVAINSITKAHEEILQGIKDVGRYKVRKDQRY